MITGRSASPLVTTTYTVSQTMKIKVLKLFQHSDNGTAINTYDAGETYDVSKECASVAIDSGWADAADAPTKDATKTLGPAPQNKAMQGAPRNK